MEHVSEAAVFAELKRQVLERVDLSREVPDEEMQELIDEVVLSYGRERGLHLDEKCRLKKELFYALRKMDVSHNSDELLWAENQWWRQQRLFLFLLSNFRRWHGR